MTDRLPFVPFGEFLPDLPALNNPGALMARNVVPRHTSYGPLKGLVDFSDAVGERVRGAMTVRAATGQSFTFIGTETKLLRIGAGETAFTDVSGATYGADEHWCFNFFDPYVTAWNGIDVAQQFELGVSSAFGVNPGTPPTARYACNAREQVMVGRLADDPQAVAWCGIDNVNSWGTNPATLADRQRLAGDGGWIMALVGQAAPHIWREKAMHVATFDGPPYGWRFDKMETERGTLFPFSVVGLGPFSFGICDDNFFVFDGRGPAQPISENKWSKFFFDDLDAAYPDRVYGAIDPVNKLIVWSYPGDGHSGGQPNHALLYHYPSGRAAFALLDVEFMAATSRTLGTSGAITSLDDLDSVSASIDALTTSLDARVFTTPGALILSAFTPEHKLAYFTGPNRAALIDTGEFEPIIKRKTMIGSVWPKIIGATDAITVTPILRDKLNTAPVVGMAKAINAVGFAPIRKSGRFARARVEIAEGADWTDALGIEVDARATGRR